MTTEKANGKEVPRLVFGSQFSFFRKPVWNTTLFKAISLYDAYAYITGGYAKEQTSVYAPFQTRRLPMPTRPRTSTT